MKFIYFYFIILIFSCGGRDNVHPKAEKGILDLKEWNFQSAGVVSLEGEWEFYWETFPEGEGLNLPETQKVYINVPGNWNGISVKRSTDSNDISEKIVEGVGYGTYKLKVILPEIQELGFRIDEISPSAIIYVNNTILTKQGYIDINPELSKPSRKIVEYSNLQITRSEMEIVVKVSNFSFSRGGFWNPIKIGYSESLKSIYTSNLALSLFISGILFIMGIYHLALYYLRRDDKSPLFFGFFCLIIFIRQLITGEKFLHYLFPDLSLNLSYKIEYLTMYTGMLIFLLFVDSLFQKIISKYVKYFIIYISVILITIVVCTPPIIFSKTLILMQAVLVFGIIYLIYSIFTAWRRKKIGAGVFLLGFIVFTIILVNDLLHVFYIINTGLYAPAGLVFFIFVQSYLLSERFSMAFYDAKEARKFAEEQKIIILQSKEEIERLGRAKDEFLANLSHEIKTPLVTIYGYSELISLDKEVPASTREYGSEIFKSAGKLNSYMDDVLLVTDLETNLDLRLEEIDLKELVDELISGMGEILSEKKIYIDISRVQRTILCDRVLFSRAMGNIIKNAIVYNREGGSIVVESKTEDEFYIIEVRDTGIGIVPENYQKIFEKFFRVDSSLSYEVSGVGLGLFLSSKILELHRGKIQVHSVFEKGSVFQIFLPM